MKQDTASKDEKKQHQVEPPSLQTMASNRVLSKDVKCQKQKQSELSEKLKEIVNSNKKAEKVDCGALGKDGVGPSHLRQLLPITLCIISFATVMSILIIYMDTTGNVWFSPLLFTIFSSFV